MRAALYSDFDGYHMRDTGATGRNGVTAQVDRLKAEGF
jgi:hypothetical protein